MSDIRWKKHRIISIVIPNKDHVEDLKKCIDSFGKKRVPMTIENISLSKITVQKNRHLPTIKNWKKNVQEPK